MINQKSNQHYTIVDAALSWGLFLGAGVMFYASYTSIRADDRNLRAQQHMEALALQMAQSSLVLPEGATEEDYLKKAATEKSPTTSERRAPSSLMSNSTAEALPVLKSEIRSGEIGIDPWGNPYMYRVFQKQDEKSGRAQTIVRLISGGGNQSLETKWADNANLPQILVGDDTGVDSAIAVSPSPFSRREQF